MCKSLCILNYSNTYSFRTAPMSPKLPTVYLQIFFQVTDSSVWSILLMMLSNFKLCLAYFPNELLPFENYFPLLSLFVVIIKSGLAVWHRGLNHCIRPMAFHISFSPCYSASDPIPCSCAWEGSKIMCLSPCHPLGNPDGVPGSWLLSCSTLATVAIAAIREISQQTQDLSLCICIALPFK